MLPDRMFTTFKTAAQGLAMQREKISVASRNIANSGTSAPKGSHDVYRPQSITSSPAGRENFKNVLLDSISTLNRTHPRHLSNDSPRGGSSLQNQGNGGLGPEFEVVETDKFRYEYDPNHPDADENGMVRYPDVDLIREMTQLVSANRLYEANLSTIEAEKEIIRRSLEI